MNWSIYSFCDKLQNMEKDINNLNESNIIVSDLKNVLDFNKGDSLVIGIALVNTINDANLKDFKSKCDSVILVNKDLDDLSNILNKIIYAITSHGNIPGLVGADFEEINDIFDGSDDNYITVYLNDDSSNLLNNPLFNLNILSDKKSFLFILGDKLTDAEMVTQIVSEKFNNLVYNVLTTDDEPFVALFVRGDGR